MTKGDVPAGAARPRDDVIPVPCGSGPQGVQERPTVMQAVDITAWRGPCQVLQDINLTLHRGALVMLLGPNGAGKSTLLAILAGCLQPDRGVVRRPIPDAVTGRIVGSVSVAPGSSAAFLLMGLIGLNAVSTGIFGVGTALIQARDQGILRCLACTPPPAWVFLGGHILAAGILILISTVLLLAVGYLAFQVPLPYRFGAWCVVLGMGTLTFLLLGAAMAALLHDLRTAHLVGNAVYVLLLWCGGVWVPLTAFPPAWQELAHAMPLAPFLATLRAVGFQNQPLPQQLGALGVISAWGIGAALVAGGLSRQARQCDPGSR